MSKGLKQLAEEAMSSEIEDLKAALPPIQISPQARRVLTDRVRKWTGWRDASLVFGDPDQAVSPVAMCDHATRTITVDPEFTLLNPNRVLLTVTPFRLRQEAVLTGALLHEAGHARHSHWKPLTVEQAKAHPLTHSDGSVPTKQAFALAKLMEEPRVEGLIAAESSDIGAAGLDWTMRAMAAHLMPTTELSMDPAQALLDLITSWTLRAGRQAAISHRMKGTRTPYNLPSWVGQFTSLLHQTIEAHLTEREQAGATLLDSTGAQASANYLSLQIQAGLLSMIQCDDDTGPTMIDTARDVLAMLFPETPGDDDSDAGDGAAMAGGGCPMPGEQAGEAQPADESDEEDSEGAEPQSEDAEPGEGGSEPDDDESEDESEAESEDGGASDSTDEAEGEAEGEEKPDTESTLAKALAAIEADAKAQADSEAQDESEQTPPPEDQGGTSGGKGAGGGMGGGWREPKSEERTVQKGAEKFLREMIDASETAKRMLTDQPSASVDGGALSAWKAGGQVREPHFFIRTKRITEPSPPIKIAILVDVSASMDVLQKPSALLSWALASAALDLRNFAGRGQQVESCLIHWGDATKIIQRPGEVLPGIREVACNQGTSNMQGALSQIEEAMPGFYDLSDRAANRLIVQFTDWKVFEISATAKAVGRALEAGVNMLSVVPSNYSARYTPLSDILSRCKIQRGATSLVKYNPGDPGAVWDQAAEALTGPLVAGSVPVDQAATYGF